MTKDEALDLALEALESGDGWRQSDAITAIKQALAQPVQEPVAWQYRDANDDGTWSAWVGCDKRLTESTWREVRPLYTTPPGAPVQEPVNTLIAAWQALEETSGHVLDVGDVEGRMHMSVIRSAWEQMDALVRQIWDGRGRP
jgi:hypothetical protein